MIPLFQSLAQVEDDCVDGHDEDRHEDDVGDRDDDFCGGDCDEHGVGTIWVFRMMMMMMTTTRVTMTGVLIMIKRILLV